MTHHVPMRRVLRAAAACLGLACASDEPTAPSRVTPPGHVPSLLVLIGTMGNRPGADSYLLHVGDAREVRIPSIQHGSPEPIFGIPAGRHALRLEGMSPECSLSTTTDVVDVRDGAPTGAYFRVWCVAARAADPRHHIAPLLGVWRMARVSFDDSTGATISQTTADATEAVLVIEADGDGHGSWWWGELPTVPGHPHAARSDAGFFAFDAEGVARFWSAWPRNVLEDGWCAIGRDCAGPLYGTRTVDVEGERLVIETVGVVHVTLETQAVPARSRLELERLR